MSRRWTWRAMAPEDLRRVGDPAAAAYAESAARAEGLARLAADGLAWAMEVDGAVMAVLGTTPVEHHPGRLEAWAIVRPSGVLAAGVGGVLAAREQLAALHARGWWTIGAYAALHFEPAHRFLAALGFVECGLRRGYMPDGADALLYERFDPAALAAARAAGRTGLVPAREAAV